jgi:hypothetical protein
MRFLKSALLAAAFCAAAAAQSFGAAGYFAVVSGAGAVNRGSGVQSATRTATGMYYVEFSRSVANCSFQATTIGPVSGYATVAVFPGFADRVRVFTFGSNGAAANRGFHLTLFCAP